MLTNLTSMLFLELLASTRVTSTRTQPMEKLMLTWLSAGRCSRNLMSREMGLLEQKSSRLWHNMQDKPLLRKKLKTSSRLLTLWIMMEKLATKNSREFTQELSSVHPRNDPNYHHYLHKYYKYLSSDMSVLNVGKMIYRNFGNSGLKVSAISLGTMINNKKENYQEDRSIVSTCLKNGVNFFDTSQLYANGDAEVQLGKILKDLKVPREEVVIATKIHTTPNPDINSKGTTNRKHIKQGIKKSLLRLQMDYVDVLYAHIHDDFTPLEEICRAFHEVIEEGHAFYWATSNWEPEVIFKTLAICEKNNLHKPIGGQNQYNMLVRKQVEIEYASLCEKHRYGIVGWSALAGGFLTGKYLNGIPQNELNRFTDINFYFSMDLLKDLYYNEFARQKTVQKLKDLSQIVNSMGFKLNHLAIAWSINYKHISSALIGARTATQMEDSIKSIQLLEKFTPELQAKVNKILDTTPESRMNFLNWTPFPPVRPVAQ